MPSTRRKERRAPNKAEGVEGLIPFRRRAPIAFVAPTHRAPGPGVLPRSLFALADQLSRRSVFFEEPLATTSSRIVTGGMVGDLRPRLEAVRAAHACADHEHALAMLLRIAAVVGESMQPLDTPIGSTWAKVRSVVASLRTFDRVELMTPFRAAQIGLDGGVGVCRDYARAVQTLFWIVQREWGLFEDARVVTAWGRSRFGIGWGHAWTWLFERDRRAIVALDLTQSAASVKAGRTAHVLSSALDATPHNNVSSLCATTYLALEAPGASESLTNVAMTFAEELDPVTRPAGAELAFHLLRQPFFGRQSRRTIYEALERVGYARPGWRETLTEESGVFDSLGMSTDTPRRRAFVEALLR